MSQFPVEDQTGITEAVNYLLSGPSGLGQNFQGFSAYKPTNFTGTYRRAFSRAITDPPTTPAWYVAPIAITGINQITANAFELTFAAQPAPPFFPGQYVIINGVYGGIRGSKLNFAGNKPALGSDTIYTGVSVTTTTGIGYGAIVDVTLYASGATVYDDNNTSISVDTSGMDYTTGDILTIDGASIGGVSGVDDLILTVTDTNDFYNDDYTVPGVLTCTTTSVIIGTQNAFTFPAWPGGGTVEVNIATNTDVSTDCNARVTVLGGTDQVFISAQIQLDFDYTVNTPGDLTLYVKVNRYYAELDTKSVTNRDYIFLQYPDGDNYTVSEQTETYTLAVSGTQKSRDFVFTTVLDSGLPKNYYWYILEINLLPDVIGDIVVNSVTGNLRSLTAQVIKQ